MSDTSKRKDPSPLWCANEAPHDPHGERNEFGGWNHCTGRPAFEQAHTPTDDEQEYESDMAVTLSQLIPNEPMWSCLVIAKKLHAAGFRRTAVQEPNSCPRHRAGTDRETTTTEGNEQ